MMQCIALSNVSYFSRKGMFYLVCYDNVVYNVARADGLNKFKSMGINRNVDLHDRVDDSIQTFTHKSNANCLITNTKYTNANQNL